MSSTITDVLQAVHILSLQDHLISMHVKREPEASNVLSYAVIYDEFPSWPIVRFLLECRMSLTDENAYKKLEGRKKILYDGLLAAVGS